MRFLSVDCLKLGSSARLWSALLAGALLVLTTACSDSAPSDTEPPPGTDDGGAAEPSTPIKTVEPAQQAEPLLVYDTVWTVDDLQRLQPAPEANLAWLQTKQPGTDRIVVDVWMNTAMAMGAAFRLDYDPAIVEYVTHTPANAFRDSTAQGAELVREPQLGQLAWGAARFPNDPDLLEATGNAMLGTVIVASFEFQVVGEGDARFDFSERSREVRLQSYDRVPMAWMGGTLEVTARQEVAQ